MEFLVALWLGILAFFGIPEPTLSPSIFASATVVIEQGASSGSGIFISPTHILTAHHVVDQDKPVMVRLENGEKFAVVDKAKSSTADLSILTVDHPREGWVPKVVCESQPRGTKLTHVGNPLGIEFLYTEVMVSGVKPENNGLVLFTGVANHGQSGGPFFNKDGELVGILSITMKVVDEIKVNKKKHQISSLTGIGGYVGLHNDCNFATWKAAIK